VVIFHQQLFPKFGFLYNAYEIKIYISTSFNSKDEDITHLDFRKLPLFYDLISNQNPNPNYVKLKLQNFISTEQ